MSKLLPEFFRRQDERPDGYFYQRPRFVTHIDEPAQRAACALYGELLPAGGHVLDLMASVTSHLPNRFTGVTGLGLNLAELNANPLINEPLVFDLNRSATLPLESERFDGAVCTVSVQYMTRPDETFAEVARSLKPGAPFIVTFSNRMFPTKAVLAWRAGDDAAHVRLVRSYFAQTPEFGSTYSQHHQPSQGDPLYAVWAHKKAQ